MDQPAIDVVETVDQPRGRMGWVTAQSDLVSADPLQVVELELLRDQDIADALLIFVRAEGDAPQEALRRAAVSQCPFVATETG